MEQRERINEMKAFNGNLKPYFQVPISFVHYTYNFESWIHIKHFYTFITISNVLWHSINYDSAVNTSTVFFFKTTKNSTNLWTLSVIVCFDEFLFLFITTFIIYYMDTCIHVEIFF